ncbi:YQGE family putative transporter [Lederbergia galactosidilyticus]|uniref:MFS transporter n=1 Tax=Lederbergia galactosidilytica TaxID=217031 RepID=UPI001AEAEC10|nr:MFS transporter [Lederbergia galactosidilytica]MBP1914788.1 YQGE family putative transporter [Lederbergia galactosidilytica]
MLKLKNLYSGMDITKDLVLLLVVGGLYSLSIALSNTFVNVYLWKQSGSYMDLAIYNLSVVVMQPITFILAGRLAKKIDRVIVLRIGVIFLALFFIAVLLFGEKSDDYLVVLGGLLGIGYGFYWLAFNVLTFEITEPETRDFFNGFMGALSSSGGIIGPITAGFIITRFTSNIGYTIIFAISLALFSAAVVTSFFLKRRPSSGRYLFVKVFQERKVNHNWKLVTNAHLLQGIREGTFVFIISVYLFVATNNELALGTYGMIHAGTAFIMYSVATKLIKKDKRKKVMILGGVILYVAIFLIFIDPTYIRLLIYGVIIGIAYPLMLVPYSSITYDVIGKSRNAAELRIEYVVVKELFLNSGRVISILLFIIAIKLINPATAIPAMLLIFGIGHTLAALLLQKLKFA